MPLYALTTTTALANLRVDLSDTDATNYRWTDAALNRSIDKAIEKISQVFPDHKRTRVQTFKGARFYALPAGGLWAERVEYPLARYPRSFVNFLERRSPLIPAPDATWLAAVAAAAAAGGSLSAGTYGYKLTFGIPGGSETLPSSALAVTSGALGKVSLTGLAAGPQDCLYLNLYRTAAGGATYTRLAQLAGLGTDLPSSYVDTASDASIAGNPAIPAVDGSQDNDQLELLTGSELLPGDSISYLEIAYACKHTLAAGGTTLPEETWDALYLGAEAFALDAYLAVVNDNFEFADSALRDKIDDTKSAQQWQAQAQTAWSHFNKRLAELRNLDEADNPPATGAPRWGEKPARWDML